MATHEWEYEIGEGFEPGKAVVTTETAPPGEVDWSVTASLLDREDGAEAEIFAREILRLAEENDARELALQERREVEADLRAENAKLIEDGQIMLKALRILATVMWDSFRNEYDCLHDGLQEALEAAGLIEMLPDQSWGLTELGGRVCRRES